MTIEERKLKLAELKATAEEHCKAYNDAYQNGDFAKATHIDSLITEAVNEYTRIARDEVFSICKESGDPMLEAVKRLTFMTIAAKDTKVEEGKIPVRSIIEREKAIDLVRLNKYCGKIGADNNWYYSIQKLNMLLTVRVCKELGVKTDEMKRINDSYLMSDIARQIDLGKTPMSNTGLLKVVQTVVEQMLGEGYKATSHDVNYLNRIYAKKGRKALSVVCANHSYLVRYLAEICHNIVTKEGYSALCKTKE